MSEAGEFVRERFAESYTDQLLDVEAEPGWFGAVTKGPEARQARAILNDWYTEQWYVAEAERRRADSAAKADTT